jgi:glyoxylase-like metal-dependent hydrolase (beta-lactamase superfamily II)
MKYRGACVALLFVTLAGLALFAANPVPKLESLQPVMPGVWFRQGDPDRFGHCNNVVIEMKDYLIVVDANFPSGARALMDDIKKVSSKPVKYVFDTHHHGDHSYGNSLWTKAGATTLAYKGVAEELKRYEPANWRRTVTGRPDVAALNLSGPEAPKQTFDHSPFVIEDSTRRVEFHFFGWAHTRGDGFVYLPKEHLLATGDAVVNGPYNGTGDANIGNWPSVVRQAMKLSVTRVLPGHGAPGGHEVLVGQEKFLRELYAAVKTAIAGGKKLADLVTMQGRVPTNPKIKLSAAVQPWVGKYFAYQVKDTFEEISQRKPHGEITGGK